MFGVHISHDFFRSFAYNLYENVLKRNKNSYLSRRVFLQWRKFWLHGKEVDNQIGFK